MMHELGIDFVRPTPIFPQIEVTRENGVPYTKTYNGDMTLCRTGELVEIKPRRPYDLALQQCRNVCLKYGVTVILMYNTEFRCPYAKEPPPETSGGTYEHSDGVVGIRFRRTDVGVEESGNVAYMCRTREDGTIVATLEPRESGFDDRVYHPNVLKAYSVAASATFTAACSRDDTE